MPNNIFGYTPQQRSEDAAYQATPQGRLDSLFYPHLIGGRNPDAFHRYDGTFKGPDAETAFETRKWAKRGYAPAAAALSTQNALFDPTLALARRGAEGYGQLWRDEADKTRAWAEGNLDTYGDPETNALLQLLLRDAAGLVGGGNNPLEDHDTVQSVRGAQSARGLGYGPSDAYGELIALDRAREARRIGRGSYGADIVGLGQNYRAANLAQLLGLGPAGSNIMSPVTPTTTDDFLSLNVNEKTQRRNQRAARLAGNQALIGSGIQAVGSLFSLGGGGGGISFGGGGVGGGANGPGNGPGGWGDYGN